jgi:hypothetical protein
MSDDAPKLHFYFLSKPNSFDDAGQTELKVAGPWIRTVKTPSEFVYVVLAEICRTGGKIDTLILSGHGTERFFMIGEPISLASLPDWSSTLAMLRGHFTPDAVVTIYACKIGNNAPLLISLSSIWGGVKVQAWQGDVMPYSVGPFQGFKEEGDRLACNTFACWAAYGFFDPRLPHDGHW